MNGHLTERQISEWTWGERPGSVRQHIDRCPACREQVQLLGDSLAEFRGAVQSWSSEQDKLTALQPPPRRSLPFANWKLVWALAVLLVCVAGGNFWFTPSPKLAVTATAATDAALLDRIDAEVSQTAPSSLQPLASLFASDQNNPTKIDPARTAR